MLSYILALVCGGGLLFFDQYTKNYIATNYTLAESHVFLKGFLDITYIHNTGGAWGLLSGHTWILLSVTTITMLICIALLLKVGIRNKLMFWAITLVMFGGIGNMIDRVFRGGKVVDFLHFSFWPQFPVFNIADCGVVIGAGLIVLYFVLDIVRDYKTKAKNQLLSETDIAENGK